MDSHYSQLSWNNGMYQQQDKPPLEGEMNPRDYGITEGELEHANLDQIKKLISASGCSWSEEQMLLQWRRTLKSRSYTKRCREKNRCEVARLEQEKARLQREVEQLKNEILRYQRLQEEC